MLAYPSPLCYDLNVYKLKQKDTIKLNKKLLAVLIFFVFMLAAGGVFVYTKSNDKSTNTPQDKSTETINYNQASPVEKKETEDHKDSLVKEQANTPPTATSDKNTVKPTITNANQTTVNAYISGIFEENGSCTATFTKGSSTLTKSSVGFQNVSYAQCAPINIDPGFLSNGSWIVSVKYSSEKSEGISDSQQIEVK